MLEILQREGLTDILCVVTRYFGGTLLGTGGLVRAYSHGASIALTAAVPVKMILCCECAAACSYNQYGKVAALIPSCGGVVDDSVFGEDVNIMFHIPTEAFSKLNKELADATGGKVRALCNEEKFYAE